jgi:hypothetical protein
MRINCWMMKVPRNDGEVWNNLFFDPSRTKPGFTASMTKNDMYVENRAWYETSEILPHLEAGKGT